MQPWAVGTLFRLGYLHPLSNRWSFSGSGSYQRFLNDTSSTATIKFSFPNEHADQRWQLWALDVGVQFHFTNPGSFRPYARGTLGAAFWDVKYLNGDPVSVTTSSGGRTDFASQEVSLRGALGVVHTAGPMGYALEVEGMYLTGIGADFSQATDDMRSHGAVGVLLKISYDLGYSSAKIKVTTSEPAATTATAATAADADSDGVPDFVDRCPATPRAAKGWVDVDGCPLDSDRDSVPDYVDRCPGSDSRWRVDTLGCVQDSDGDGIPDSGDLCAGTLRGLRVDSSGCPDYPPINDTVVLRFEYASGATRLDAAAQAKLLELVPNIRFNPTKKLTICGYTDNVGATESNLALSQKRAQVVKEFLVAEGIPASQLVATGKGEARPVASNETTEGRALNRRIEIVPMK